jgi:hypothetical protein
MAVKPNQYITSHGVSYDENIFSETNKVQIQANKICLHAKKVIAN